MTNTPQGNDLNSIENRLIELESRLIEQDHRPVQVIATYLKERSRERDDPRRKSALRAILWRLFFSPGVLAASGGLIAVVTASILVWQNFLIRDQNAFFQQQIVFDQLSLASSVIYSPEGQHSSGRKRTALVSFVRSHRQLFPDLSVDLSGAVLPGVNLDGVDLARVDFNGADLRGISLKEANLASSHFENCDLSMYRLKIGTQEQDLYSDLRYANLADTRFVACNFYHADLSYSNMKGAEISAIEAGQSSGTKLDGQHEMPMPLMIGVRNLSFETKTICEEQYQAITDIEALEAFLNTLREIQSDPKFLQNKVFVHRNNRFYGLRLNEARAIFKHQETAPD